MLNNGGAREHPCLVPGPRGNAFCFSPLKIMFVLGISYMALYVEVGSFYAHLLKSFNHKWVLNFVKGFSCIYWDCYMVFIFQFVNMMYHVDWIAYVEESLHPWSKPNLILVYELFDVLLFCLLKFCWGFLHLCSVVILSCGFAFLWVSG